MKNSTDKFYLVKRQQTSGCQPKSLHSYVSMQARREQMQTVSKTSTQPFIYLLASLSELAHITER